MSAITAPVEPSPRSAPRGDRPRRAPVQEFAKPIWCRIVDEVRKLGASEELKTIWASNGAEYGGMTQPQFAAMVSSEVKRWAAVVKASGAKLD